MFINQPYDRSLGAELIDQLLANKYDKLTIIVAYAKLSGVNRLLPYLCEFKKRGGSIRCIVGIDQQNTSYEAIKALMELANELYVFHSEDYSQTFHIKCYWLCGADNTWYAIGSNNLTAGGLFSNYEMCSFFISTDEEAKKVNSDLESVYNSYVCSKSCCKRISSSELELLFDNGYILKEESKRKELIQKKKRDSSAHKTASPKYLFGAERFRTPALPSIAKDKKKAIPQPDSKQIKSDLPLSEIKDYLIRLVPRAGDRSKQVHFTKDLLDNYFCLKAGDVIWMQEIHSTGIPQEIEQRQIVLSQRNKNVKIELSGASILDEHYPTNPETRPVLIIKRINATLFSYMVLLPGHPGYDSINDYLLKLPPKKSLPDKVIDIEEMLSLWDACPLI